jgi:myosin heavy subunit
LLEAQQAKTDDELQAARAAKMDAEARVATAKTAKLRALERERALDVELARERQATADKLARLQETKRELEQAKADKAKQAAELEEVRRQAAREFEEAQRDLAHFQAVGKRLVEDERNRLSRDRLFQKSHSEAVEGMRQCMESQELLRTRLDAVVLPISDLQSYLDNSSLFPQDAVLAVVESPLPRPPLQSLHSNLTQQQAEAGASLKAGQEPPRPDWDSRKIGSADVAKGNTAEEEGQFSTVV